MQTMRTFIAIDVSAAVRAQAARLIEKLRSSGVKARWVEPSNLHLTLKFLGDVPNTEVAAVCQAVKVAVLENGPFDIHCQGAGAFPEIKRPRTVWLGLADGNEEMRRLQEKIDIALAGLGFPREPRRFHPHLTLGRLQRTGPELADLARLLEEHEAFDAGKFTVEEVQVVASFLEKTGPTHDVMGRARL